MYRVYEMVGGEADADLIHQGDGYATDLDDATAEFLRWRERAAVVRRVLDVAAVNRSADARVGAPTPRAVCRGRARPLLCLAARGQTRPRAALKTATAPRRLGGPKGVI